MTIPSQLPLYPADRIWSPKMRAFGRFWAERRRDRQFPARADFPAEDWGPWWTSMLLYRLEIDAAGTRVYRLVYQGDAIEYIDGGTKIGRRLDEIAPPHLLGWALGVYDACVESGMPVYSIRIGTWHRAREVALERLLLPLGAGPVDHVAGLLFDHGMDPASRPVDGVPPISLRDQRMRACRIEPDSLEGCDVTVPGTGIGLAMPDYGLDSGR